jgi:serine/threonine-protein kinase RsbW
MAENKSRKYRFKAVLANVPRAIDCVTVIRVRDWGMSFDPDSVPEPNVDAPLEERTLGGLGIFLIKQYMDEVHFSGDSERGNELAMVKWYQIEGKGG